MKACFFILLAFLQQYDGKKHFQAGFRTGPKVLVYTWAVDYSNDELQMLTIGEEPWSKSHDWKMIGGCKLQDKTYGVWKIEKSSEGQTSERR